MNQILYRYQTTALVFFGFFFGGGGGFFKESNGFWGEKEEREIKEARLTMYEPGDEPDVSTRQLASQPASQSAPLSIPREKYRKKPDSWIRGTWSSRQPRTRHVGMKILKKGLIFISCIHNCRSVQVMYKIHTLSTSLIGATTHRLISVHTSALSLSLKLPHC